MGCCLRKVRPPAPREGTRGVLQAPRAPESVTATRLRCPAPVKLCRHGQGPRAVTFHAPLWITNLSTKKTGNGQGSCSPMDMHVAGQPPAVAEVSPTPAGAASVPRRCRRGGLPRPTAGPAAPTNPPCDRTSSDFLGEVPISQWVGMETSRERFLEDCTASEPRAVNELKGSHLWLFPSEHRSPPRRLLEVPRQPAPHTDPLLPDALARRVVWTSPVCNRLLFRLCGPPLCCYCLLGNSPRCFLTELSRKKQAMITNDDVLNTSKAPPGSPHPRPRPPPGQSDVPFVHLDVAHEARRGVCRGEAARPASAQPTRVRESG